MTYSEKEMVMILRVRGDSKETSSRYNRADIHMNSHRLSHDTQDLYRLTYVFLLLCV